MNWQPGHVLDDKVATLHPRTHNLLARLGMQSSSLVVETLRSMWSIRPQSYRQFELVFMRSCFHPLATWRHRRQNLMGAPIATHYM